MFPMETLPLLDIKGKKLEIFGNVYKVRIFTTKFDSISYKHFWVFPFLPKTPNQKLKEKLVGSGRRREGKQKKGLSFVLYFLSFLCQRQRWETKRDGREGKDIENPWTGVMGLRKAPPKTPWMERETTLK